MFGMRGLKIDVYILFNSGQNRFTNVGEGVSKMKKGWRVSENGMMGVKLPSEDYVLGVTRAYVTFFFYIYSA